ncbi:hypothetical protein UlMin_034630 [Ulmus minor]
MAISRRFITSDDAEAPLLDDTVASAVDYKGRPVRRSNSGGWRSAGFIIGVELAERFAYYGIQANLITYLSGPLGESTATAAANVNAWSGVVSLLPLVGAFVADSFLGRYRTILLASLLYILGLGLLTVSAILPSLSGSDSPSEFQVILFFCSLYLVAIAQSGHKPCAQAFGADQFDGEDPRECKGKSSFFNWWYFGVCVGGTVTILILSYIQDNLSWALGFGIPCVAMVFALVIFLLGTTTYRHILANKEKSPFVRIGSVFAAAFRNRGKSQSTSGTAEEYLETTHQQFKFLNKALIAPSDSNKDGNVCSLAEVEEAKAVLRLVPIWATSLIYGIVFAQVSTFFTKQGATMDRTVTSSFKLPAAALQCFMGTAIVISVAIYDRIFVPIARSFTGNPSGITMLQRIGTGIFISIFSMVVAALVEMKRLKTAEEFDLVDTPSATIPMSVWWLVPQYVLIGEADAFTIVGLQEFFYDQVPKELRSIGLALYLSVIGVGSLLSSFLVSIIGESWFSNNLNKAHLDYFYWLLASLSIVGFLSYIYFARSYIYNRTSII